MSLLAGLGKGLVEAGQAVGRNMNAYSQMLSDEERERMRQASMEKRWAIEDSRYNARVEKEDQRYKDGQAKDDERYQDSTKRYEAATRSQTDANARANERDAVNALSSGIERLDKIRADKEAQIKEMFVDPMTKTVTDQEGYRAAMSDLRNQYTTSAAELVQRSGLDENLVNKYGFSTYLPTKQEPQPIQSDPEITNVTAEPKTDMPDISGFINKIRGGGNQAKPTNANYDQLTGKDAALEYLLNDRGQTNQPVGLLSPEQIKRQEQLKQSGIQSAYGAAALPTYQFSPKAISPVHVTGFFLEFLNVSNRF